MESNGNLACPKRSLSVCPFFPRFFRSLFSAPLPYSSHLFPLTERLEQAYENFGKKTIKTSHSLQNELFIAIYGWAAGTLMSNKLYLKTF